MLKADNKTSSADDAKAQKPDATTSTTPSTPPPPPEAPPACPPLCERCDELATLPEGETPTLTAKPIHRGLCAKHGEKVDRLTAEGWARKKGMAHEFSEGKRRASAPPKAPKPLIHNPKFVHFHRARASHGWAPNEEMTEAEFDKAVAAADGHVYR